MNEDEKNIDLQKQLDSEDIKLRAARLERLYDEELELRRTIAESKKTIRECKSRLTQNEWFIRDQLRLMIGRDKSNQPAK